MKVSYICALFVAAVAAAPTPAPAPGLDFGILTKEGLLHLGADADQPQVNDAVLNLLADKIADRVIQKLQNKKGVHFG